MKTVLLLLAVVSAVICAPAPEASDDDRSPAALPDQQQRHRVTRQLPDILGQVTDAIQEHVVSKQERVLDAADTLGKVLGSAGDAVRQAISDHLGGGADGGQRSAGPAAGGDGQPAGQQVGQVLADLGGRLLQAVTDAGAQRAAGGAGDGDTGPRDQLEEAGRKVGHMLVSVLRKSIQQDDEVDDGEARLVAARPALPAQQALLAAQEGLGQDQAPCRGGNGPMMMNTGNMADMGGSRRRPGRRGGRG